jgi:hypothetical protein
MDLPENQEESFQHQGKCMDCSCKFLESFRRIWEMMERCHKMFAGQVIINPIQTLTRWHSTWRFLGYQLAMDRL